MTQAKSQAVLASALLAAAAGFLLLLPRWAPLPGLLASRTDERLSALDAAQSKLDGSLRGLDARLIHVEEARAATEGALDRVLPRDARWIPLRTGGGEAWDFPVGGRVAVQFLHLGEDGAPVFRVQTRAGDVDTALRPGVLVQLVDDLGTERRIYQATLNRLRLDRGGRAEAALVSAAVSVER